MKEWSDQPQRNQMPAQPTDRTGSGEAVPTLVNDNHLLHELIMLEIGPAPIDLGIVQGQEAEFMSPIELIQSSHLESAETAVSIEDHDMGFGPIGRSRELESRRIGNRTSSLSIHGKRSRFRQVNGWTIHGPAAHALM
jgi:hypothetical protein